MNSLRSLLFSIVPCLVINSARAVEMPVVTPLADGLKNPESVIIGVDKTGQFPKIFIVVSEIGEFDVDGDGKLTIVDGAKRKTLADGLDDPKGMAYVEDQLFVADKTRVWRVGPKGGKEVFAAADAFPTKPLFLNDVETDEQGNVYVSDSGDLKGGGGAVYKITPDGKVSALLEALNPKVKTPNGLLMDGPDHLLVLDFGSGELNRLSLKDKTLEKIADGLEGGDGIARDFDGNVYVTQWSKGVLSILRDGKGPAVPYGPKFTASADLCLNFKSGELLVPDMKAGTLVGVSIDVPTPAGVDQTPLTDVKFEPVFTAAAEIQRAIVLTHAGDGSGRVFIASQLGNLYYLQSSADEGEPRLFMDFQSHVTYADNQNEEGLLGFAFHPKFKENGQFFLFYTKKDAPPHMSVISRFTVSKSDPNKADPASEQEILRIPQPFWNHNGGTIAFGPDGMLYVGLGDGGAFNDPYGNGQKMSELNGKILRIDVDRQDPNLPYAVPKDNPFVGQGDARGEIWALGFRNIWRMAFDRKNGDLWAADVGQDIWEEIDLVVKGGNYGWKLREGMHRFRPEGSLPDPKYIEPIWEYHHDVGKSITGGNVYRGTKVPELDGWYLYADYIRGTVWALKYDPATKKTVANREIPGNVSPVVSFGEDEAGETYFMTTGSLIYRLTKK